MIGIGITGPLIGTRNLASRWTPADISSVDVFAYFDVTRSRVDSGGFVTSLPDLSGSNNNASDVNGGTGLVLEDFRNGLKGVSAKLAGQRLRTATWAAKAQPNMVYVLGKWAPDVAGPICIDGYSGTARHVLWQNGSPRKVALFAGSSVNTSKDAPFNLPFIARILFSGAASTIRIEVPGQAVFSGTVSTGAQGLDGINICTDNGGTSLWAGTFSSGVWCDGAPSASDDGLTLQYLRGIANLPLLNFVAHGNSLTLGQGATNQTTLSYPAQMLPDVLPATVTKVATSGATTSQLTAQLAASIIPLQQTYETNVLMIWEGGNSIFFGRTPAEAWSDLVTYVQTARALGWTGAIATSTCGPRNNVAWSDLQELNQIMRDNWATDGLAYLVDPADDPSLDPPVADGVHYDDAQYGIIADYHASAVNAYLNR